MQLEIAETSVEVIEKLSNQVSDVIFINYRLPGIDGIELKFVKIIQELLES
jgi:CheY-like chemotaxis protein